MAAVEAANNANGSTYLWDDIRMAEQDTASKAAKMQKTNQQFTTATPIFMMGLLFEVNALRLASSPTTVPKSRKA